MRLLIALALLLGAKTLDAQASFDAVLAQPTVAPAMEVQWGRHPAQRAELYLPRKTEETAIVVLIHGGCWLSDFNMGYMRPMAEALSKQGWTVWSVSYRRLGHGVNPAREGLRDLLTAIDRLPGWTPGMEGAPRPVWLVGHSAGGHLALLAAAESAPGRIAGVVGLAAITDLSAYAKEDGSCNQAAARLLEKRDIDTNGETTLSSIRRLPLGLPQLLVQGEDDAIVPTQQATDHVAAARAAGDQAEILLIESAGHFEPVLVDKPAFLAWTRRLDALAR